MNVFVRPMLYQYIDDNIILLIYVYLDKVTKSGNGKTKKTWGLNFKDKKLTPDRYW